MSQENNLYCAAIKGRPNSYVYVSASSIDQAKSLALDDQIIKKHLAEGGEPVCTQVLDREGKPRATKAPTGVLSAYETIEDRQGNCYDRVNYGDGYRKTEGTQ